MALRKRQLKSDLVWLKWSLLFFAAVTTLSSAVYFAAQYFRNDIRRQEFDALSSLDAITGQVEEVAISERVIVENIDRFNTMSTNSILDEEDRIAILEEIRAIRERHQLFPIGVEIAQQVRILLPYSAEIEFPEEQISLRSSRVQISLPLLHEEDLTRFLGDFLNTSRLMVTSNCTLSDSLAAETDIYELVEHQYATCEFYWYTLRREPYTGS